jgi:hypothetical protein
LAAREGEGIQHRKMTPAGKYSICQKLEKTIKNEKCECKSLFFYKVI